MRHKQTCLITFSFILYIFNNWADFCGVNNYFKKKKEELNC